MFLMNLQAVQRCASLFSAAFAAISEALYSDRFLEGLSTLWFLLSPIRLSFPVGPDRLSLSAKP
jgi:hypothetical protein